jgi:putative peptidoglycan lipid II flippase
MTVTSVEPTDRAFNRSILRAAGSVASAAILVKLAATFKEFVVAGVYGRSDAMDAFLVAFLIPNLLINLVAESMNQALIPTFIRVKVQQGLASAQRLLSSAMAASCALLVCASLAMTVLARSFFPLLGSNFSTPKLDLAVHLFYALLPVVVLSGIASNCTAVLNATETFALPALLPIVTPVITVAGVLLLFHSCGIWAVVDCTVAGALLQALLSVWMMKSHVFRFRLGRLHGDESEREVVRQYGPVLLSSVVASGGLLLDQSMAAMLPAGSVSALVFAGRFVSVAVTLLASAVATALIPYFSTLVAHYKWSDCRHTLRSWVRLTAAVSLPIALLLILGAPTLVRLTLQHGAFGTRDTAIVSPVLAMYAIQIPFFVVSRVYYRFIVAMRRSDLVLYCGLLNLGLDAILNLVLMRLLGVAGIALATSLWTVSTFFFLQFWSRRLLRKAELSLPLSADHYESLLCASTPVLEGLK